MIWIVSIALGAIIGAAFGALINSRVIFYVGNWIPTFVVLGGLWGLSAAYLYKLDMKNKDKGMLLTETKEYQKRIGKKKDKTEKKDQQV